MGSEGRRGKAKGSGSPERFVDIYPRCMPSASLARFSSVRVHLQASGLVVKPRGIGRSPSAGHFLNATPVALVWGLNEGEVQLCPVIYVSHSTRRNSTQEDPKSTLYFAHLFFAEEGKRVLQLQ